MNHLDLRRGCELSDSDEAEASVTTEAHGGWSAGWVAALSLPETEADKRFGIRRDFCPASSKRLSRAGNGTKTYKPSPGIYQADSVYRSYRSFRVVFVVEDNGAIEILSDSSSDEIGIKPALDRLKAEGKSAAAILDEPRR